MKTSDVFAALDDALTGNTALMAAIEGVYDDVPDEAKGPYLVYGDLVEREGRLMDCSEREVHMTLHVFSSYDGRKETFEVADLVKSAIGDRMTVSEVEVGMLIEEFQVLREEGGWWHGILSYRTYLDE